MLTKWGLSTRATNIMTKMGCPWTSLEDSKAFAAMACALGIAEMFRSCGQKTVAELREWSGLNERNELKQIEDSVHLLMSYCFDVHMPSCLRTSLFDTSATAYEAIQTWRAMTEARHRA